MGMDHVERAVVERKVVDVALPELGVTDAGIECGLPGLLQHILAGVDADEGARSHQPRHVEGDGPGPAPHVEDGRPREQVGPEIGGRIFDRAPPVGTEHAVVMAVEVPVVCHVVSVAGGGGGVEHPGPGAAVGTRP